MFRVPVQTAFIFATTILPALGAVGDGVTDGTGDKSLVVTQQLAGSDCSAGCTTSATCAFTSSDELKPTDDNVCRPKPAQVGTSEKLSTSTTQLSSTPYTSPDCSGSAGTAIDITWGCAAEETASGGSKTRTKYLPLRGMCNGQSAADSTYTDQVLKVQTWINNDCSLSPANTQWIPTNVMTPSGTGYRSHSINADNDVLLHVHATKTGCGSETVYNFGACARTAGSSGSVKYAVEQMFCKPFAGTSNIDWDNSGSVTDDSPPNTFVKCGGTGDGTDDAHELSLRLGAMMAIFLLWS